MCKILRQDFAHICHILPVASKIVRAHEGLQTKGKTAPSKILQSIFVQMLFNFVGQLIESATQPMCADSICKLHVPACHLTS